MTAYLVFVALMLGSFINLVLDRLPRRESIVRPRSHCRGCDRQLTFVDLLPIAGYFLRRGRCASCGTPIGIAAPAVEALCAALMLVPIGRLGLWTGAPVGLALIALYGSGAAALAVSRSTREGVEG